MQGQPGLTGEVITVADDFGHVPVLLDRCVELLTPALTRHEPDGSGAVLVDATLGAGGHSERFLTDLPGLRVIGLDRDPSALQIAGARLERFADRFTAGAHPVRRNRCGAGRMWLCGKAIRRRRAVRPGRVVDAAGSHRTGLLLRVRCATGHADGSGPAADGRRHPQHLRSGANWRESCVEFGEERFASPHRGPDRATPAAADVSHHRRTRRAALRRHPGAGPTHRRPSRQAHLPGAAHRGQRRTGVAAGGAARRAGCGGRPAGGWW